MGPYVDPHRGALLGPGPYTYLSESTVRPVGALCGSRTKAELLARQASGGHLWPRGDIEAMGRGPGDPKAQGFP